MDSLVRERRSQGDRRQLTGQDIVRFARFKVSLLDYAIALGRKSAGFCALLVLGWLFFREVVLGQSLRDIYPGSADPELRQTVSMALLLVLAQGWDIPTDHLTAYRLRLRDQLPRLLMRLGGGQPRLALGTLGADWARRMRSLERSLVRSGRLLDLFVAISNKVGALTALGYLLYLADQYFWTGSSLRQMYPDAGDPVISLLADVCVYVVILSWWAMPFEQIVIFWDRLWNSDPGLFEAPSPQDGLPADEPALAQVA